MKDSVRTGHKFQSLRWQASNNISNRHNIPTEPSVCLAFTTSAGKCDFEVGRKKMKKILNTLGSAQEFLDSQLL